MKKICIFHIIFFVLSGLAFGQSADSSGTGFFINDNGIVITCAHVIENADRVTVRINNSEYPAEILAVNDDTDLAVLKINYRNPYHFRIVDFSTVNLGERLSVLGYPLPNILSTDIRYTQGNMSARSGLKSEDTFFQHSAPTHPGNSGGPIFNQRFEVVGVAAAIINDTIVRLETGINPQNINFGVKSGYINSLLNEIRPGVGNIRSINDAENATVQVLCYYTSAQNRISVTVVNRTGYTGWYLYVSPASNESWGSDRLGTDILASGSSVTIRNVPAISNNRYDIRLVDSDGDSYTKWNVSISDNSSIVFTFDDYDTEAAETYDGPPITIVNNTGYTVWYVYISSTESDVWGRDRLAAQQTLPSGESVILNLPFPLNVVNHYDIRLVDLDGDSYIKMNELVNANSRIVFTMNDFDRQAN